MHTLNARIRDIQATVIVDVVHNSVNYGHKVDLLYLNGEWIKDGIYGHNRPISEYKRLHISTRKEMREMAVKSALALIQSQQPTNP